MEVAYLPRNHNHDHPDLPRANPVPPRLRAAYNAPSMPSSHASSSQPPSLRSSDSTQATAQSVLFNPPPLPTGTPVQADNNVLNKRADKESSLFQICLNLRQRLKGVPGLEDQLLQEEEDADEDTDIVTLIWRTFRRGYPLMAIYNALQPRVPLIIDESKLNLNEKKRSQAATFKFLHACVNELKFPTDELFIITDLYGDDTTGFVKVSLACFDLSWSFR